eukprot:741404-Prymnesium_polylepis.1
MPQLQDAGCAVRASCDASRAVLKPPQSCVVPGTSHLHWDDRGCCGPASTFSRLYRWSGSFAPVRPRSGICVRSSLRPPLCPVLPFPLPYCPRRVREVDCALRLFVGVRRGE